MAKPKPLAFTKLIAALLDDQTPFPPRYLHRLSDLAPEDAEALAQAWPKISPRRRGALIEDLEELNQADDLLSFEDVCRLAMHDPAPNVRASAVRILREYELPQYIPDFIRMAQHDTDVEARAASVTALGTFIYLGEVDELPDSVLKRVEEYLLGILNGKDVPLVRRRALEALGYSSLKEVGEAIEQAYASDDAEWLVSALNAMGHSANRTWKAKVVSMLDHSHPLVRAEAASAAGELEIKSTVPALIRMLRDPDQDVRMAVIWALSQVGGKSARPALEKLLETTQDDEEEELLENALDNLDFTEDLHAIALLNISGDGEDDDEFLPDDELDDLPDDEELQA